MARVAVVVVGVVAAAVVVVTGDVVVTGGVVAVAVVTAGARVGPRQSASLSRRVLAIAGAPAASPTNGQKEEKRAAR
jgi:uncharacterized membrane protein YfcA